MELENTTVLSSRLYAVLSSGAKNTKFDVPPCGEDFIVTWVCFRRMWNCSAICGRPALITSTDRSDTHGRGPDLLSINL
jgi:hypothetical protein